MYVIDWLDIDHAYGFYGDVDMVSSVFCGGNDFSIGSTCLSQYIDSWNVSFALMSSCQTFNMQVLYFVKYTVSAFVAW